jgi:hypothetical protein
MRSRVELVPQSSAATRVELAVVIRRDGDFYVQSPRRELIGPPFVTAPV